MVSLERAKVTRNRTFSQYRKFVPQKKYSQILFFAKKLKGVRITVVSSTSYGGGVAEIWHSLVPIFQSLGVNIVWYTIAAPWEFFDVTKKFHNLLQGAAGKLTEAEKKLYLKVNKKLANDLAAIPTDILLVHDPQPAVVIDFLPNKPISIWRCHIDTSTTNRSAWEFLKQFIANFDHLIFTLPEYANGEILGPAFYEAGNGNGENGHKRQSLAINKNISFFQPTIDPFDEKLTKLTKKAAWKILSRFGLAKDKPLILAPSRFDPFKDQFGVFDAFLLVLKHAPQSQLLFTGPVALDDPESVRIRKKLVKKIKKTPGVELGKDVFVYTNLDGFSYLELAAAYNVASVVIQKSLAEGFGLTVAEAGFFGKTVIGGNVGGIAYQIVDYNQDPKKATGILVDITSPDRGILETAFWIEISLKDKKLARTLGKRASLRVIKNFLHPQAIFNYLVLFNWLIKKEIKKFPKPQLVTYPYF